MSGDFVIMNRVDPSLRRVLDGYVVNFLKTNFWRVCNIMEWDDAVQEAWLTQTYMEKRLIKNEKDSTIETPQQYMAFFVRSWTNHFHTLSKKDTKFQDMCVSKESELSRESDFDGDNTFSLTDLELDFNVGYMEIVIEQAPSEVREVLSLVLNTPKEVLESVALVMKRDVMSNVVLCRLLGHDPQKINVVQMTESYFNNL